MQTLRKKNSPCKFKKEPTRFLGEGVSFKAKLIGILEVSEARGDRMCQAALADLKMAIRAAGEHKQRIAVQVSIDGLRLRDEKTGECLYHHPVHKISFIAQDMSDSRAFGYIFGSPDTGHRFFGIKTDKAANQVVIAMRDLFQVVFELKKKEIELTKQNIEQSAKFHISGIFVEPAPDTKNGVGRHDGQGAAGTESCLQRIRTASLDTDKVSSNMSSNEKKNEGQTGVIADLLDLQFELNSLQQGIHQLDKITPDNPRPSSEDPFESDPFGDSFANMKVTSSVQPILPPPPSSSKRGHLERQATIPATVSTSLTSSPAPHTVLSSKTPPPQETVKWLENDGEKRFSDGEIASLTNNGSTDEDRDNGSIGIGASQRRSPQIDVFTELDPLGTGLSKPYIDKKDFFQHLKNPPKKVLKDLVTTNSGDTFPTNFDITLDPLDPIRIRNDVGHKSTESFEDGDFANFETFDNDEVLPETTVSPSPQLKSESPQQLSSNKSNTRTIHHQPLSVSLPPEDSPIHHKSCSLSNNAVTTSGSSNASVVTRIEKESHDSIQSLMRLPSPKKYQSMKRREHEGDITGIGRRRESIDKPFPVDFSRSTESCSSEANSRLSSSSAELEIVPEPPPRGSAGILINPPPLPPKKQAIRGGSVKPPPRPPYTDSQYRELHYDFIEREETSPSPTRREHTQSPGQMDSIKSRFDDNFSPSSSRTDENASFRSGSTSRFDTMTPTTLSALFRNPYIGNSPGESKRVANTAVTSSSFVTTTAKPSLDITLSQLTSSNLAEFATSLDMSVTELTNLTLQQLTECLARLSAKEVNGSSGSQRHSASPTSTCAKLVETSFVSSEPLFKADFDNDGKQGQQMQQAQEHPVYDKYAVFRELVEMEQMKEEIATKEIIESHEESSEEQKDTRNSYSMEEKNEMKDRLGGSSDLLSSRDVDLSSNESSKNRNDAMKEEDSIVGEEKKKLQSISPRQEVKTDSSEKLDRVQDEDEEVEEIEEMESKSISRDTSLSGEKPRSTSVTSPMERQTPKNLAEQDLLKLFSESSAEAIAPRKNISGNEGDSRMSTDIFEEIRMLNSTANQSPRDESKTSGRLPNKMYPTTRNEEKAKSFEKPETERAPSRTKLQNPKRIEEQSATGEYEEEEAEEEDDMESRERSSSEEKPTSLSVTSPTEQQTPKNLADQDLMKLFAETSTEAISPRKAPTTREEELRAATDIFEEIRMLNNAGNQQSTINRPKEPIRPTTTSGFEDVFCPFVEPKQETKDTQESFPETLKDEGNWAKFENTGVFNSDKSSYEDPASVGGTSPWSPDEKDFHVEGGRKVTQKQQHRLHSGESDNEWKDEEESEESNGRRQFREEGGYWYGRHPRMELGEESPYYEDPERLEKDWHFCERERGGRKFRGGGLWSGKQPSIHRVRDPSPWHEEAPGGRWPRDEEEQPSPQQQQQPQQPPHHSLHRGRYPMSRKQLSGSYKEELDEPAKSYWKCRTKQRAWNGDRDSFRNPNQQPPVQQPGHYVGDPMFYEDERTKKRMMLWSSEREEDCDRDRFSSQESMGYEDEERWSRREYENRRRGDKWEEEMSASGSRFWPRRPPGEAPDYVADRPVVPPSSQTPHEIYRKQHYCRTEGRDPRERSIGHELYSSGIGSGGTGSWLEDEYSLPDRADNSPRYMTRKRHWPKRPNSANDERNMGEPVYADPRIKYGMSRSECSDNDSELYHRPYRSRSRESYWGSDQEFESWTGSGSERLYWSEGPDAKSETLHRRRINRHKSARPAPPKSQSSPFEDDFAETLDRNEPSFDSFVMDASRGMIEGKAPTTPRNVKEHARKADPRSARYGKPGPANRSSGYFENETVTSETSPRIHTDVKTTPESFPPDLPGKPPAVSGEAFVAEDNANRDSFFNGDPSPRFDDDAFAFESEMADSVPETTSAGPASLKNSRQIKYGNNKIKGDHDIKKSESVNIFVRESDPFDDDDFFK